jgi:hypothetical protein
MALGSTMLQLSVIQEFDEMVSEVEPFFAEVFELLTLGTVTVREIAMEKMGGVAGNNSAIPIEFSTTGFATLRLLFSSSSKEEVFFLAPSHVPSPQVTGAGAAILELQDVGLKSTGANLQVARHLGAHAYLDEA